DKQDLFSYLGSGAERLAARAAELAGRYRMGPLETLSTASLYRKNLYPLDILERAAEGLPGFPDAGALKAVDVGAQDWHYVFGLERWLRHRGSPEGRTVRLKGIE